MTATTSAAAESHRQVLAGNRLFRGVPAEVLEELVDIPSLVQVEGDRILFEEGAAVDYLYLIVSGSVRVSKAGRGGRQETLSYFEPGDFFGEMAFLDLEPRSAQACTVQPCTLGRVDHAGFERLLRMAPGPISQNLTNGIVGRLRRANTHLIAELTRAERLSLIGAMAAAITHDFKNPMSAILMAADLIGETSTDPEHFASADVIKRAVGQMVAMTEELLDFARGTPNLRLERVEVDDLMAAVDDQILRRLERDGLRVVRRVVYRDSLWIDRNRFARVLVNVLKNAAEAMPEGGDIGISVDRRGPDVVFIVSDTGTGIPEEIFPTLFEPFVTAGKKHGTGLGMAIAKSVVESHGGRILVVSSSVTGTIFEITIPAPDSL